MIGVKCVFDGIGCKQNLSDSDIKILNFIFGRARHLLFVLV